MSNFNTYSVDSYIGLGFTLEQAEAKVAENKKKTAEGIELAAAEKRIAKFNFTNISPQELLDAEASLESKAKSKPTLGFAKPISDLMEARNVDTPEAFRLYEDAVLKFPTMGRGNIKFIEYLYGKDSKQYAQKLEHHKACVSCSFEKFSESYDDKELAYKEFCIKYGSNNKDHLKRKHGVDDQGAQEIVNQKMALGKQTYETRYTDEQKEEISRRKGLTLQNCIGKYGEAEGTLVYQRRLAQRDGQCSLEYYIKKYGEDAGKDAYAKRTEPSKFIHKIEYWVARGLTVDEARVKLKEYFDSRPNFSLQLCIDRYGSIEGPKIHKARTDLWQNTLKSKPQEEIDAMNVKKGITLDNMIRKYGVMVGHRNYMEWYESIGSRSLGASSIEGTKFFLSLYRKLKRLHIIDNRNDVMFGTKTTKEYYINDRDVGIKFYDFAIRKLNFIAEYNGVAFHPREGDVNWKNPYGVLYEEVLANDKLKKRLAEERGFEVFYVWSDEDLEAAKTEICQRLLEKMEESVV